MTMLQDARRLAYIQNTSQKLARIYTGLPIMVKYAIGAYAGSSDVVQTEAAKSFIARITVPNTTQPEKIIAGRGIVLHEISHLLYTRIFGIQTEFSGGGPWRQAYNILEDARIEWTLIQQFPGTRPYFITMLREAGIIKNSVLMWGRRKYYPMPVERISGTTNDLRVEQLIDAYMVSPTIPNRWSIAKEFSGLMPVMPDSAFSKENHRKATGPIDKKSEDAEEEARKEYEKPPPKDTPPPPSADEIIAHGKEVWERARKLKVNL